jgi:hypothetical protein
MSNLREEAAIWVGRSCGAQGLCVQVINDRVIRQVLDVLGASASPAPSTPLGAISSKQPKAIPSTAEQCTDSVYTQGGAADAAGSPREQV